MAIQNLRQHLQRIGVDIFLRITHARRLPAHDQQGQISRRLDLQLTQTGLHRLFILFAFTQAARRDPAIGITRPGKDLRMVHIPHHHQRGVIGHIPAAIPVADILHRHLLQITHPANNRAAVRMRLPGHRIHGLVQPRGGLIIRPHAALFHHDLDFLAVPGRVQGQMTHPVRLERHHGLELIGRHLLEIGGVIRAGKGIVTPAHGSHPTVEFAGAHAGGALEHHVLGDVCHARHAIVLVHAAHPIPDHLHRRGRAVIFAHHHLHAIGQAGFKGVGIRSCIHIRSQCGRDGKRPTDRQANT